MIRVVCIDSKDTGDAPELVEGKTYKMEYRGRIVGHDVDVEFIKLEGINALYNTNRFLTEQENNIVEREITNLINYDNRI
jgi:hypothetical protein